MPPGGVGSIVPAVAANPDSQATPTLLQIGEVVALAGLSFRTVRYWDEVGLVVPSARTEGGFRLYSPEDVDRLLLVKAMKPLKLTLAEMRELADMLAPNAADSAERDARLAEFEHRAREAIVRVNRHLEEAREIRARIGTARRT